MFVKFLLHLVRTKGIGVSLGFRFLTNCRKFFFFFDFFLKFVCTRSTKEFLRTSLNVSVRFRSNWNLEVLVNMKRGKPEYPEKKLLEQRKEPTTNSTHIW